MGANLFWWDLAKGKGPCCAQPRNVKRGQGSTKAACDYSQHRKGSWIGSQILHVGDCNPNSEPSPKQRAGRGKKRRRRRT